MVRAWFAAAVLILGSAVAHAESGIASRYGGDDGLCGRPIASGGRLDCHAMHAAHRTLRFGTMVKVTASHSSVVVRIVDRGPWKRGRVIDLTPAAMRVLGCDGLCRVSLEVVSR